jgi:ribosomal protein S18 acetylase RimI-like enzyme
MIYKNELSKEDLQKVAELHYDLLGDGFLASFGVEFLYLLYREIYGNKKSTLIICRNGSQVSGFVAGGLSVKQIYFGLLKDPFNLVKVIVPKLIRQNTFKQLLAVLFRDKMVSDYNFNQSHAELYSICVAKEYHGTGIATELYTNLSEYFSSVNIDEFLIVVGEKLKRAQEFYQKQGAARIGNLSQGSGKSSILFMQRILP